jgi:hypothetical protein
MGIMMRKDGNFTMQEIPQNSKFGSKLPFWPPAQWNISLNQGSRTIPYSR